MQDAFRKPPASVYDTYVAALERFGACVDMISPEERRLLLEVVAFTYTCAVGRMTARLPQPAKCRRTTDAVVLQILDEAQAALAEIAHATADQTPPAHGGN